MNLSDLERDKILRQISVITLEWFDLERLNLVWYSTRGVKSVFIGGQPHPHPRTSWSKTKTFVFVLEAPRDQDPGLVDYITGL